MGFRKILFISIGLSFLSAPAVFAAGATAQTSQSIDSIGILGGLAITGASIDTGTQPNYLSGSSRASFKLGVAGQLEVVTDTLSLELDLLYSKYKWDRNLAGTTGGTNVSTSWWELPLFANYVGIEYFKFGMGPVFDFATGDVHTQNSNGSGAADRSYAENGLGTTSVGLGFQAGFDYPLNAVTGSPLIATVDLRYVMGLTNLSLNSPETDKLHSFDILFGVGYAF